MPVDSDKSLGLSGGGGSSTTSCVFQPAEERDDIPGVGDDSVLEMLSYSKFSDLETWLCMPSTLLPRVLEAQGKEVAFLKSALGKETPFLMTPLLPWSKAPPGGLLFALVSTGSGSVLRDFGALELSPVSGPRDHAALRKAVSIDDRLLRPASWELHLQSGRKKVRNIHVTEPGKLCCT
ncbi:hypothetical protein NHX12_025518, partial [Muraenolepis orangiensis]